MNFTYLPPDGPLTISNIAFLHLMLLVALVLFMLDFPLMNWSIQRAWIFVRLALLDIGPDFYGDPSHAAAELRSIFLEVLMIIPPARWARVDELKSI